MLFQPHLCAWADIRQEWLEGETIERVSATSLTVQEFIDRFERPNRPVIITDLVPTWRRARALRCPLSPEDSSFTHDSDVGRTALREMPPAALTSHATPCKRRSRASREWSFESLKSRWGATPSHAGGYSISLADFLHYSDACAGDDQPLYLFDKAILAGELSGHFEVPEYFSRDLFALLGDRRPDFRWLIVGPARSGSSFHQARENIPSHALLRCPEPLTRSQQ